MTHLDWQGTPIEIEFSRITLAKSQLSIRFRPVHHRDWVEKLADVYLSNSELRMTLPQGWTLFWKKRELESRVLLAHPDADHWVGTVALESRGAENFLLALKSIQVGQSLKLGSCVVVAPVSNLEIVFELVADLE